MSADNDLPDHLYRTDHRPAEATAVTSSPVMNLPPIRQQKSEESQTSPNMTSVVARPFALPLMQDAVWREHRPLNLLSRPRSQDEKIELPSIRQAVPEIQLKGGRTDTSYRVEPSRRSPVLSGRVEPFGHDQSYGPSQKRQRTSIESLEVEARHIQPGRSRSPLPLNSRNYGPSDSPISSSRRMSIASLSNSRSGSTRTSPHARHQALPSIRSPPLDSTQASRQDNWRPTLPGIPSFNLDRSCNAPYMSGNYGESRSVAHTYPQHVTAYESPNSHHNAGYSHGYHTQPRGQSYSGPISRDRTPFSAASHHYSSSANFTYGMEMADVGSEGKQRKRRGNLPKETTDKLRAWFHAHIQHPYPTEDEKQELMRQTGLQMNQISNWFINARRRQLPAMINNARAESEARSARSNEPSLRHEGSSEYANYRESRSVGLSGESDDGGSNYGEDYREAQDQRAGGAY